MSRTAVARAWFGATALAVLVGVVVQVASTVSNDDAYFQALDARIFNVFCYFTVQSNLIVGVTCLLLALRLERTGTVFAVFRLTGVVAIAITGVVYHTALADLQELDGSALVADQLLHTVVPLMAVLGWLVLGPRGRTSWRIATWTLAFPAAWLVFALIRGALIDFYPYPFLDVGELGYARAMTNCVVVAVLVLVVSFGATALDRALAGRNEKTPGRGADPGNRSERTGTPRGT